MSEEIPKQNNDAGDGPKNGQEIRDAAFLGTSENRTKDLEKPEGADLVDVGIYGGENIGYQSIRNNIYNQMDSNNTDNQRGGDGVFCQRGDNNTQNYTLFAESPFEDSSIEARFPEVRKVHPHLCAVTVEATRKFLAHSRWLVILRDKANRGFQYDMVSFLIQSESSRRYRTQDAPILCSDYIKHCKKLTYDVPTLTKVFVKTQNRSSFIEFFKEVENASGLTHSLKNANNMLVFIIDSDDQIDAGDSLKQFLGDDTYKYACWRPTPPKEETSQNVNVDELSPTERSAMVLAAWFNAMPHSLFCQLVHELSEAKLQPLMENNEEDSSLPDWWQEWLIQPDKALANIGLENSQLSDQDLYSTRCANAGDQLHYRQLVQSKALLELGRVWPLIKQHLFLPSQTKVDVVLWREYLIVEVASFLEHLHVTGLVSLDVTFFEDFYQEVRLANTGDSKSFFKFVQLLEGLHDKPSFRGIVGEFVREHQRLVRRDEGELEKEIKQHQEAVETFEKLPRLMPELAILAQQSSDALAQKVYLLKDRAYAGWFLLIALIPPTNDAFLPYYLYMVNHSTKRKTLGGSPLISYNIYVSNLLSLFASVPENLVFITEQLCNIEHPEDRVNLFEICRYALLYQFDNKPDTTKNIKGLDTLCQIITHDDGIEATISLLYPNAYSCADFTDKLFFSLIRIKKLLNLQKDENPEFDELIKNLLNKAAKTVTKPDYLRLRQFNAHLFDQHRERFINNTDKNLKMELSATKKASLFVKQAFKRTGE